MSHARQVMNSYPGTFEVDAGVLATAIEVLKDCALACTADAADDLSERIAATESGGEQWS